MSKLIQNDDQYNKALSGLVTMAAKLEDPLSPMTPAERERTKAIYDLTAERIQLYKRGRLVQQFPGLREKYTELGWEWQEFGEPRQPEAVTDPGSAQRQDTTTQQPEDQQEEPELEPPAKPTPKKSLMAWLDDDD
ncbi:hypothetical protein [Paenibacillus campinasensis]|uniref:Uncharacterized protein n=1 Tax=Paenibacillus campinasensis TaxID=66347 RepID=A0A268ELF4_9BACL|nr:hypothetical protein [Paenibacillus campinasensis]PAD73948.1 hypothetical protein CHH67_19125 [Paenibacillus campinasensis]